MRHAYQVIIATTWHYIFAKPNPRLLKYQLLTAHTHAATVEDQLGEVDGFGRMFPHGSTDFCLSGIFFSADLYESSMAFRFSSSCGVNGGLSPDKLRPGISDWAEATPVNRATTAAAWITFRNIFWAKCVMRLICSRSREAARAEFRT